MYTVHTQYVALDINNIIILMEIIIYYNYALTALAVPSNWSSETGQGDHANHCVCIPSIKLQY